MSFWSNSKNETIGAIKSQEVEETPPLPDNTRVRAVVTDFKWMQFENSPRFISYRATVVSPAEYKGHIVFCKIEPFAENFETGEPAIAKRDRSKEQLAVMLTGVGYTSMPEDIEMNDAHLHALEGNMYSILFGQWVMKQTDDQPAKKGNWVKGIKIANEPTTQAAPRRTNAAANAQPTAQQPAPQVHAPARAAAAPNAADDDFDDIPF